MKLMGTLLNIAWRNIFRNPRRTFLTLSVLVMGCMGIILIGGFLTNAMRGLREQMIHSQYGHLQVSGAGYHQKGVTAPFEYMMKDVSKVSEQIEMVPHVLFTVPRLMISGMANSEDASISVIAIGTDRAREERMGSVKAKNIDHPSIHVIAGQDLDEADPYGAVVGKGLLKNLGLKVGDTINFMTSREAGAIDGAPFHVRGVYETVVKDADDHTMKVNLSMLQKIAGTPGQVHKLLVVIDETENTDLVKPVLAQRLKAAGLPVEVLSWNDVDTSYAQTDAMRQKIDLIVQVIISIVFFFSVANTVNMALMERIREFGTMMAIGNGRGSIFSVIFLEVIVFGVVGSVIGILIACLMAKIVSSFGIQMPPPPQGSQPYTAVIVLDAPLLIRTFIISMVSTILSGIIPAYRACHFRIIEALGYV